MQTNPSLPPVRQLIEEYGLLAKKSLGQHFLLDPNILQRIVSLAGNLTDKHVIEIGPGPGALTRAILSANPLSLTAIELDMRVVPLLERMQAVDKRLNFIHADALTVDLHTVADSPRIIIANLPYNVATRLVISWLKLIHQHRPYPIDCMVLMFQKEVAQRIVAAPGGKDYGRLAILSQWLCEAHWGFDIPAGAFLPPPKVTSSVIVMKPRQKLLFEAPFERVEKVVGTAFGQRRKMLRAALKSIHPNPVSWLEQVDIDPERRAETLSIEEFGKLIDLAF